MQDSQGRQKSFKALRVSCEKHHDWWNVAGSLLSGHYEYLLNDLPPDAIKREFKIHLKELA